MTWEIEYIPDEDLLYRRVRHTMVSNGKPIPAYFRDLQLSANWCKYSSPELTRQQAVRHPPDEHGVIQISVGGIRAETDCGVFHRPEDDNRAHSEVDCEKTEEVRLKLRGLAEWVINPPPE